MAVSLTTVASPAQVRVVLAQAARIRPELAAFFGCLYYTALRPEEAVTLRRADLILRARGRGKIIPTAACPRTGSAWTNTGTSHEPTGLKHRPGGTIRVVPIPPVLVSMVRRHLGDHGTTTDGRLFRGARGGMLSESVYGRIWHAARRVALGPDLAATALARRQRIEDALDAGTGITHSSPRAKASGCTHRRHLPRPCPLYVREPARSPAHSPRKPGPAAAAARH